MKYLLLFISSFIFETSVNSQAVIPFTGCPDVYVIAYKDGFSCTQASYNFYTLDINGNLNSTPFATTLDTLEINGLGINSTDAFLYGLQTARVGNTSPCTFRDTRLIRMDQNGGNDILGFIKPPLDGAVSSAVGCVALNNQYYFLATVGPANYVGVINNINLLPAAFADSLNADYLLVTSSCIAKFSDWAFWSNDGLLYSYGIYLNAGTGLYEGTVIKTNPVTGIQQCTGLPNTTEFNNSNDNFGGLMFGTDGFLYGVNVLTRIYYKINISTGEIVPINTIPGSGQLRGDMGSCVTGTAILPVCFISFNGRENNCTETLTWQIENSFDSKEFDIERSTDGIHFSTIGIVPITHAKEYYFDYPALFSTTYYRIKKNNNNGSFDYSSTVLKRSICKGTEIPIRFISMMTSGNEIKADYYSDHNQQVGIQIIDVTGKTIQSRKIMMTRGINSVIVNAANMLSAIYFIRVIGDHTDAVTNKFYKVK